MPSRGFASSSSSPSFCTSNTHEYSNTYWCVAETWFPGRTIMGEDEEKIDLNQIKSNPICHFDGIFFSAQGCHSLLLVDYLFIEQVVRL